MKSVEILVFGEHLLEAQVPPQGSQLITGNRIGKRPHRRRLQRLAQEHALAYLKHRKARDKRARLRDDLDQPIKNKACHRF